MILNAKRSIFNDVVETTITIKSFGSSTLSAEEEKEIFNDYRIIVPCAKILFSRWVVLDENNQNPSIVRPEDVTDLETETVDADNIVLVVEPLDYEITEDMEITYSVDISAFNKSNFHNFKYIKDKYELAKACCLVFEDCIITYIQEQIDINKAHRDAFEEDIEYIIN